MTRDFVTRMRSEERSEERSDYFETLTSHLHFSYGYTVLVSRVMLSVAVGSRSSLPTAPTRELCHEDEYEYEDDHTKPASQSNERSRVRGVKSEQRSEAKLRGDASRS